MNDKQGRANSRSRPTQTVASFLLKTFEILERPDFDHIISWDKDDEGFVVKNLLQFTNEILPKYFRHNNFSSFVRQLNMYDFHKIKQNNDNFVFKNPLFQRGGHHLLKDIKRKASKRTEVDRKLSQLSCEGGRSERNENVRVLLNKSVKEAKTLIEAEVANSASLFQKSITVLETQMLHINSIESYSARLLKSLQDPSRESKISQLMDLLYSFRKVCFNCLSSAQNIWQTVDSSCFQKQQLYEQLLNICSRVTNIGFWDLPPSKCIAQDQLEQITVPQEILQPSLGLKKLRLFRIFDRVKILIYRDKHSLAILVLIAYISVLLSSSCSKNLKYNQDGTGRDTYIYHDNGGYYPRGKDTVLLKDPGSYTKYAPMRSTTSSCMDRPKRYTNNGTGRDSYIYCNDGGYCPGYTKTNFLQTLRGPALSASSKRRVRTFNSKQDMLASIVRKNSQQKLNHRLSQPKDQSIDSPEKFGNSNYEYRQTTKWMQTLNYHPTRSQMEKKIKNRSTRL